MLWPFSRFRKQPRAPSRCTIEAIYGMIVAQAREPLFYRALKHDDSGSNRSEIMNVIDSNILERDAGGKPLHTFPHPALGVPDTVDGRFDMVLLHLWMVLRQLKPGHGDGLRQALFDHFCSDMDANLREMGVGDLSVPKRMRAFGEAFYGRSAAYDRALVEGQEPLAQALDKNIYSGRDIENARRLAAYAVDAIAALAGSDEATLSAGLRFPDLAQRT